MESLTTSTRFQSLYIRQDYIQIYENIKPYITKPPYHILITGTPGIGKSMFAYYVMWRFIQENDLVTHRNFFFQTENNVVLQFKGNKVILLERFKALMILKSLNKQYILFADMSDLCEPVISGGITIVFASPNPKRYKEFIKVGFSITQYMDPWNLTEILTVRNKSYPHLTENRVRLVYTMFGGVSRFVLEKNVEAEIIMDQAFGSFQGNTNQLTNFMNSKKANDDSITYKLVHYWCNDPINKRHATLRCATEYVAFLFFEKLNIENIDNWKYFAEGAKDSDFSTATGNIFQFIVNRNFPEKDLKYDLKYLPYSKSDCTSNITSIISSLSTDQYGLSFYDLKDLQNHRNAIQKNTYYHFRKSNFESIDSFAIVDKYVLGFQITIAKDHRVLAGGLLEFSKCIQNLFPNEKFTYHLIFIVRDQNAKKMKNQRVSISPSKTMNVSETIIINEFQNNQWTLIYNLMNKVWNSIK